MTQFMRRSGLALTVLAVGLSGRAARGDVFTYPDFSSPTGLKMNGSAASVGGQLQLTPPGYYQSGSAFTTNPTSLGNLDSFSTHFQFQITNSGGIGDEDGPGADGIVFVVQTVSNNVGAAGGGLGYQGINHSLGIEFDTYNNGAPGDHDGNHAGIDLNGNINSVVQMHEPTRFNNGAIWNVWADYNGTTHDLGVNWSMSNTRPSGSQLSYTVDLESVLGQSNAFLGFTASTGAGYGRQNILNWAFRDSYSPIGVVVPEPSTMIPASLVSLMGLGYAWNRRRAAKPGA